MSTTGSRQQVCDALRCPGPHAHDNAAVNVSYPPAACEGLSFLEGFPSGGGGSSSPTATPDAVVRRWTGKSPKPLRDVIGARCLLLFSFNEECLVSAGQQPALIASLPFVHTARRCYRWRWDRGLRKLVARLGNGVFPVSPLVNEEFGQYLIAGGSKSRNKVAVGEPAAGSFTSAISPRLRVQSREVLWSLYCKWCALGAKRRNRGLANPALA